MPTTAPRPPAPMPSSETVASSASRPPSSARQSLLSAAVPQRQAIPLEPNRYRLFREVFNNNNFYFRPSNILKETRVRFFENSKNVLLDFTEHEMAMGLDQMERESHILQDGDEIYII